MQHSIVVGRAGFSWLEVNILTGFLNCGFGLFLVTLFISSTLIWRAVLNSSLHSVLRGRLVAGLLEEERPVCAHIYTCMYKNVMCIVYNYTCTCVYTSDGHMKKHCHSGTIQASNSWTALVSSLLAHVHCTMYNVHTCNISHGHFAIVLQTKAINGTCVKWSKSSTYSQYTYSLPSVCWGCSLFDGLSTDPSRGLTAAPSGLESSRDLVWPPRDCVGAAACEGQAMEEGWVEEGWWEEGWWEKVDECWWIFWSLGGRFGGTYATQKHITCTHTHTNMQYLEQYNTHWTVPLGLKAAHTMYNVHVHLYM